MGGIITPSYRSGFYSPERGGIAKYPGLWRGCVGAFAPCLGPTGLRLFDQSGYGNHGTLTDMEADTDWTVTDGYGSLEFGGTNEWVNCGTPPRINGATFASISAWIWRSSTAMTCATGCSAGLSANGPRFAMIWFTDARLYFAVGGVFCSVALPGTGLRHIIMSFDGSKSTNQTRFRAWVNGVEPAITYVDAIPSSLPTVAPFGLGRDSNNRYGSGRILDSAIFDRTLGQPEASILSRRPGIAYERSSRTQFAVTSAPAFKPYWARRTAQVLGGR